jgi:predicted nucleic acid-binding protein
VRIFFDLNVLIDIALTREPFISDSACAISNVFNGKHKGYISATSITTFYYLVSKRYNSHQALKDIKKYTSYLKIAEVNDRVINMALNSTFKDFEDAVQYYSALLSHCEIIITRNTKDFIRGELPVYTPQGFLELPRISI